MEMISEGFAWYVVFLFSVTFHEASHAYVAMRLGDPTAYEGGQVTLEPTPHIRREPFGMVAVPVISYLLSGWMLGWGSIPYNFEWALRNPRHAAWMALAGPVSNLILVFAAAIAIHIGMAFGWFSAPESIKFTRVTHGLGEGIMDDEKAESYLLFIRNPMFSFIGILIAWNIFSPIYRVIHLVAINLLYPGITYG